MDQMGLAQGDSWSARQIGPKDLYIYDFKKIFS